MANFHAPRLRLIDENVTDELTFEHIHGYIALIDPADTALQIQSGLRSLATATGLTTPFYFFVSTEDDTTIRKATNVNLECIIQYLDTGVGDIELVMYDDTPQQVVETLIGKTNTGEWRLHQKTLLNPVRCYGDFSTGNGPADILLRCSSDEVLAIGAIAIYDLATKAFWGWTADLKQSMTHMLLAFFEGLSQTQGFTGNAYDYHGRLLFTTENGLVLSVALTERVLQFANEEIPQFANETIPEVIS